jgi:hypothetical protein
MIIKSLYIGLAGKVLPPANAYSNIYNWDITPHWVPM